MSNSDSNPPYNSNSNFNFKYIFPILILALLCIPSIFSNYFSPNTLSLVPEDAAASFPPTPVLTAVDTIGSRPKESFSDLITTFERWDHEVGCERYQAKFKGWKVNASAVQDIDRYQCSELKMLHVNVHVKISAWVPDTLEGLYMCRCRLSCLWTRNEALADKADVWLWVTFQLANGIINYNKTFIESYATEKLFYALDAGSVPIYFGAPNVWDLVPPNSIKDGTKFKSMEELADYVKAVAEDPVAYAEFHAWRQCGVLGNYGKVHAASLDTLPCWLCEETSVRGGRNAPLKTPS